MTGTVVFGLMVELEKRTVLRGSYDIPVQYRTEKSFATPATIRPA